MSSEDVTPQPDEAADGDALEETLADFLSLVESAVAEHISDAEVERRLHRLTAGAGGASAEPPAAAAEVSTQRRVAELLGDAQNQADRIIANARSTASRIIANAEGQSESAVGLSRRERGSLQSGSSTQGSFADDTPVYVISVAAQLSGLHPQTLRMYDRMGLVSPGRTAGRGRRYSMRDIAVLQEIQRLSQEEGVNLAGIKHILEKEHEAARLRDEVIRLQALVEELTNELESTRHVAARLARLRAGEQASSDYDNAVTPRHPRY